MNLKYQWIVGNKALVEVLKLNIELAEIQERKRVAWSNKDSIAVREIIAEEIKLLGSAPPNEIDK